MRKRHFVIAGVLALGAALWFSTPPALEYSAAGIELPTNIDEYLARNEAAVSRTFALVPDTEKRVRWQQPGVRTPLAIVNLHGFSATRHEVAPLAEIIADRLGANLFETRLTGHGHTLQPMHEVRAEDWLADAAEALAVGEAIGDDIILIGTSTGATLALAMSGLPEMQNVRSMIFVSPNLSPYDPASQWLTRPAGPLIARVLLGDTRSWTAHNEQQAIYWSTSYPTSAIVEVMRLVDRAQSLLTTPLRQELLVLMSPGDTVVSPEATRAAFATIDSPRKQLHEISNDGDPSQHVLAGDILAPDSTAAIAELILEFLDVDSGPGA